MPQIVEHSSTKTASIISDSNGSVTKILEFTNFTNMYCEVATREGEAKLSEIKQVVKRSAKRVTGFTFPAKLSKTFASLKRVISHPYPSPRKIFLPRFDFYTIAVSRYLLRKNLLYELPAGQMRVSAVTSTLLVDYGTYFAHRKPVSQRYTHHMPSLGRN